MRDKPMLEYPEKMCEYCCNFDKEHIGMDGMALCKLTMTLAYAEDYGGHCMFYNVPKEQIIVPPCKVGDKVYSCIGREYYVRRIIIKDGMPTTFLLESGLYGQLCVTESDFGSLALLNKEEAEAELVKRSKTNA